MSLTMNTFIHDSINRMMNTYTMDLIRLFADKHHFNANEAYDAFLNSLRNNNLSLSKTESNTEPALSEPALSEPALSEPAVVDTEKSANKGRPKKVKESIIENHEDEELENVNTVIKQLMESDDDDEEEEEEEEEVFQSEELIEYTAAADKETPHAHIEKEEDKKASLDKEEKAAALKKEKEEKAAALKRDKEEKAAALKRDKEEKAAALKRDKEEKAEALKKEKEEKAAALKKEKEEKAAALKKEKEEKKTSEKKKTTKKNEKTEDKTTEYKTTEERKETTEKNVVITTQDNVDLTEEEYEDEDPFPVKNFTYKGKVYLKGCGTNVIYDKDTQDVIGEWEEKTNTIYFIM